MQKYNPLEIKPELVEAKEEDKFIKAVQVASIYESGMKTPFWEHFRSLIEEKIELLDEEKDNCPDNGKGFRKWRAVRSEIRILRNLLRLPKHIVNVGKNAQLRLDDLQKQAEAKAAMQKKAGS